MRNLYAGPKAASAGAGLLEGRPVVQLKMKYVLCPEIKKCKVNRLPVCGRFNRAMRKCSWQAGHFSRIFT